MDSHEEDAAGGLLAALVLHERARILGAYNIRTSFPSCMSMKHVLTLDSADVLHHLRKELLRTTLGIRHR